MLAMVEAVHDRQDLVDHPAGLVVFRLLHLLEEAHQFADQPERAGDESPHIVERDYVVVACIELAQETGHRPASARMRRRIP